MIKDSGVSDVLFTTVKDVFLPLFIFLDPIGSLVSTFLVLGGLMSHFFKFQRVLECWCVSVLEC